MEVLHEAPEELSWERAIRLFVEGWAADHPGIRQTTLGHYHEQLANRIAAFAAERGIASVQDLTRQDLRAFVVWLDSFVTKNGRPLTPRGKQMALATTKQFLGWLYQERLIPEDVAAYVATYRLDTDPEPRAVPGEDLPLTISDGREVVKPEVAELMAEWLKLRSRACPHLGEGDALFVTLGPNQFAFGTNGTGPEARPPGERLTTDAVRTILKRLAAKAGVDPHFVTPHRLHHYFGLTSAMAGVPTTALMGALGHRTPLMTARYSEFADAERRWAFARADITNGIRLPGASPARTQ